jgi:tetratricopeptide (TPR) repeat protein
LVSQEEAALFATRCTLIAAGGLVLLLQACATAPPVGDLSVAAPVAAEQKPAAEITLNLPDQAETSRDCAPATAVDRTFLDKGFTALAAGDHREAVSYFRRYQRLESSPGVDWEAGIAIAYDKMLPESPYYNWRAAREDYLRLVRDKPKGLQVHEQILLMQEALAVFADLHVRINDLQKESDILSENLEKREEALRRLRELTLGQKGSAP